MLRLYTSILTSYLCCSHAYFLDLVLVKHESHKSDTEPLKLHHVSSSKHHVSEPFAPQVLLIQIKKKHQIAAANSPTEPGGVGTPGNRGHLKKKPIKMAEKTHVFDHVLVGGIPTYHWLVIYC